jgi:hypothetical protein
MDGIGIGTSTLSTVFTAPLEPAARATVSLLPDDDGVDTHVATYDEPWFGAAAAAPAALPGPSAELVARKQRVIDAVVGKREYSAQELDSLMADLDALPPGERDAVIAEIMARHDQQGVAAFLQAVAAQAPERLADVAGSVEAGYAKLPAAKQTEFMHEAMCLRGPGSDEAKLRARDIVGAGTWRGELVARSMANPEWGWLRGTYFERPAEAAAFLRDVGARRPGALHAHFAQMAEYAFRLPLTRADESFLQQVADGQGSGAARVKAEAVEFLAQGARPVAHATHYGERAQLQGHVDWCARLLAQPEVVETLMHEDRRPVVVEAMALLVRHDRGAAKDVVMRFAAHKTETARAYAAVGDDKNAMEEMHDIGVMLALTERGYAQASGFDQPDGWEADVAAAIGAGLKSLTGPGERVVDLGVKVVGRNRPTGFTAGLNAAIVAMYDAVWDPDGTKRSSADPKVRMQHSQGRDDFVIEIDRTYETMRQP